MGAQTRTDVLPYISLIPVFGYLWPGTSIIFQGPQGRLAVASRRPLPFINEPTNHPQSGRLRDKEGKRKEKRKKRGETFFQNCIPV